MKNLHKAFPRQLRNAYCRHYVQIKNENNTVKSSKWQFPVAQLVVVNQSNCIYGFFKLPSIRRISEDEQKLSHQRRACWLALINRKNLTNAQLSEKNSTLRVCGKHFISGRPSQLFESTNPDWAPTLHLGHDVKSPEKIRYLRAKRRREQKSETEQQAEEEEKMMRISLSEEEHVMNQWSPHEK